MTASSPKSRPSSRSCDANRDATHDVVLSVPTIDVRDRVLVVEYRRLAPELEERGAEQLIVASANAVGADRS